MTKITLPKNPDFILFGGGLVLRDLAIYLKEKDYNIIIITSKRHAKEIVKGKTLIDFLSENNFDHIVTEKLNKPEITSKIKDSTIGISFGAAWIFNKSFIDLFNNRLLNLHSRDLPRNRGAGGSTWYVLNNEKKSANTLHLIDDGIDTGGILRQEEFTFPESCTIPIDYDNYTSSRDFRFLKETIELITKGNCFEIKQQNNNMSTYFPRLYTPVNGKIDWSWSSEHIVRFICAFDDPYCGASTNIGEKTMYLKKCKISIDGEEFHPFCSGIIYRKSKSAIYIAASPKGIEVNEVFDENGNDVMGTIKVGDRLYTPYRDIELSKSFSPIFGSKGLKSMTNKKKYTQKEFNEMHDKLFNDNLGVD